MMSKIDMAALLAKARKSKAPKESKGLKPDVIFCGDLKPEEIAKVRGAKQTKEIRPDIIICDDPEQEPEKPEPMSTRTMIANATPVPELPAHIKERLATSTKEPVKTLVEREPIATKSMTMEVTSLADRLAALKKDKHISMHVPTPLPFDDHKHIIDIPTLQKKMAEANPEPDKDITPPAATAVGMHGEAITYNSQQQEFIDLIASGESCVLIGAAGTGKTTCSKGGIAALIASGKVPILQSENHKHLQSGAAGILIISYTRRAVNNIRKVQSEELKPNCITAHKLLEYQPNYYEITDPETGDTKNTMCFEPSILKPRIALPNTGG